MIESGAIYFNPNLKFHDGLRGEKLMVLLNTPLENELCIFVKTTSQPKNKRELPGCLEVEDCYFIKQGTSWFNNKTWIQLFENYPMKKQAVKNSPLMNYQGHLSVKITKGVVDCYLKTQKDDLSPFIKELLMPKYDESLLKLQEKFSTK